MQFLEIKDQELNKKKEMIDKNMNIVFMGTPDFAKESLRALVEETNENVIAVVTNPDKPKGRGMNMIASEVKEYAIEKNIPVYQPEKVRGNEEFIKTLYSLNPDLLVVVAYGKILPKEVLDIPKYGAINVHGSLLPELRGAAPIQWAVINGLKETGITTMFMDEGMDTGDMILKEKISISQDETTGELWDKLKVVGGKLLVETIKLIRGAEGSKELHDVATMKLAGPNYTEIRNKAIKDCIKRLVHAEKQDETLATYAPMLEKEMGNIDWEKSKDKIHNLVRGLDPIMGAYTFYNGEKIKIWKTNISDISFDVEGIEQSKPGTILNSDKRLLVKTGDNGIIEVIELQANNSKRMNVKDFLNGRKLETNIVFGRE